MAEGGRDDLKQVSKLGDEQLASLFQVGERPGASLLHRPEQVDHGRRQPGLEQADEGGEPDWAAEVPKGTGLEAIPRVGGETSQQRLERSSKEVNLGGGLGQWQKSSVDNLRNRLRPVDVTGATWTGQRGPAGPRQRPEQDDKPQVA